MQVLQRFNSTRVKRRSRWRAAALAAASVAGVMMMASGCETQREARGVDEQPDGDYVYATEEAETTTTERRTRATERSRTTMSSSSAALAFPTGDASTSALLIEAEAPAEILMGDPQSYRFRVTNLTDQTLSDVRLIARDAQNLQFVQTDGIESAPGEGTAWRIGDLGPNESRTVTIDAESTQPGQAMMCLTAQYTPFACLTTNVIQPQLELAIQGPPEVLDCEDAVYVLRVSNPGVGPARNVEVSAELPDGMRPIEGQPTITRSIGVLEAGATEEIRFNATPLQGGQFEVNAVATAENGLRDTASTATVVRVPDLVLNVESREQDFINVPVEFIINVMNEGDGAALNTVIAATVPQGTAFEGASDGGELRDGQVHWDVGRLPPGAEHSVRFAVRGETEGTVVTNAVAQSFCENELASRAAGEAQLALQGISALLLEVVDTQDPVRVGADGHYVIAVRNQGSTRATNIVVEAFLEPEMEFVSADGPTRAATNPETGAIQFAPLPDLPAGEIATWEVTIRSLSAGDVRFKAQMRADQLSRPVIESESTHLYQ